MMNRKKRKEGFRKRKFYYNMPLITFIVFIVAMIFFRFYNMQDVDKNTTYYTESGNTELPVIYQNLSGYKVNELHAYTDDNYKMVANETLSLLDDNRKFNMIIQKNSSDFTQIEYEIREKFSNELLERTRLAIPVSNDPEVELSLNIQNLIKEGTTYTLQIKIDLIDRRAYYFTNVQYKKNKNNLNDVLKMISDFTLDSFDKRKAESIVKYLETSPNRDLKQLYKINIESSFEQITWAETNMELVSDLSYRIHQAQDYCYNINIYYLSRAKNDNNKYEYYISVDKYVIRWDERRYYVMKFERTTEELFNIDNNPFDIEKNRLYLGVCDNQKLIKKESANGRFFAFAKQNEIYLYDDEKKECKLIYANKVRSKDEYDKLSKDFTVKLYTIDDIGNVRFIVYGYNMKGVNEGLTGISIYEYDCENDELTEKCFVPLYTTYENLKYDLSKLSTLIDNTFYFKAYDKVYSVNINTEETIELINNMAETKCASSVDGTHIAYNIYGDDKKIYIFNISDFTTQTIEANEDEIIEVIGCMNNDLFYGITKEENLWIEDNKIIGRPYKTINAINMKDGTTRKFDDEGIYYYNFVTASDTLRYNTYHKDNNHFNIINNGVILNNYKEEIVEKYPIKEETTKNKLRISYVDIDCYRRDFRYSILDKINQKMEVARQLEERPTKEKDIFYVYNSGELVSKRRNLSDGITEIRDSFGYVKLNDLTTCYNRSNKANALYIRTKDSILDNIKEFKEDFCLINYEILVVNITGATERDLEYYISLGEKVAAYKDDEFKFFVTGYDNNNYVLEYIEGERQRILTPRSEVNKMIKNDGYILFAQLEKLE